MKKIFHFLPLLLVAFAFQACSLDEDNPGGSTMNAYGSNSEESYQTILNQIYFGMERYGYGTEQYMHLTEGDTDLWTYTGNISTSWTQFFWYYAGGSPNTTYLDGFWNSMYDGIGACETAIQQADNCPFKNPETKDKKVAEARFMRAAYYFNLVEQFGAVTVVKLGDMSFAPQRTDPMTIYRDIIIPDLEFAAEKLDRGTDATTTQPTKKAALGMLAKACLQTHEYGTDEYVPEALETAKKLIADAESGGSQYGAYMYPTFEEVFKEENNFENKEALWKHRWYGVPDGSTHGSSNGNYKMNRNDENFLCHISKFGARVDNNEAHKSWEGSKEGLFMPTQHLLSLFVQADGTLDPRFHKSFQTEWNANKEFTWSEDTKKNFHKDASVVGQKIAVGEKAIKIIMPQDADYQQERAQKAVSKYLTVDYADVYNDQKHNVIMELGGSQNLFKDFYPSLTKHNSSHYCIGNEKKNRYGNLNATFIMRMAEVYFIAAEADLYINGGANAMQYINKVRQRAGVNALSGTPTLRTILDEKARELCGEYCRFMDLHRTGMLKDNSYLMETHPDLGQFFKPEYALRPISTTFIQKMEEGLDYQNPGY